MPQLGRLRLMGRRGPRCVVRPGQGAPLLTWLTGVNGTATATLALLSTERGRPEVTLLRTALISWAFNVRTRSTKTPPDDIRRTLDWLSRNTHAIRDLEDAEVSRRILDALTKTQDGKVASAGTIQRRRGVIVNALSQAVERKLLHKNPVVSLSWTAAKTVKALDKRVVLNSTQARALLGAVRYQGPSGSGLVAFFAVMYYSALRPGEALNLRKANLLIPESGWGELLLDESCPSVGTAWSDSGNRRDQRQLKHLAKGDTRSAPSPPELTQLFDDHARNRCRGPTISRGPQRARAGGEHLSPCVA
jgi:integrase